MSTELRVVEVEGIYIFEYDYADHTYRFALHTDHILKGIEQRALEMLDEFSAQEIVETNNKSYLDKRIAIFMNVAPSFNLFCNNDLIYVDETRTIHAAIKIARLHYETNKYRMREYIDDNRHKRTDLANYFNFADVQIRD